MKHLTNCINCHLLSILFLFIIQNAFSQQSQTKPPPAIPDTSKITYNQISKGLKLFVFPAKGQSQQQQKTDEFERYKWAQASSQNILQ